jgi:hypothetical protein
VENAICTLLRITFTWGKAIAAQERHLPSTGNGDPKMSWRQHLYERERVKSMHFRHEFEMAN